MVVNGKRAGRPVDHQKTLKVFESIDIILADEGIANLSVERIARNAGISKATLYRRFGPLKGILSAYVETFTLETLKQALSESCFITDEPVELEQVLVRLGVELMWFISQPRVVAFDNAMLSAGKDFSEIKESLYSNGPQRALTQITELLSKANLSISGMGEAHFADVLFHLWRSGFYDHVRVTGIMPMSRDELEKHIIITTRFFLSSVVKQESER